MHLTEQRSSTLQQAAEVTLRKLGIKHSREIKELYAKHQSAFQKVGLVKYDAFKEMGGKLSFCLVLLDENDTGILINSIHNTSGCFCYSKKIKNGKCDIVLGEEEQLAVDICPSVGLTA